MPRVEVAPSPRSDKKYRATLPNGTTVDFGQADASDYTVHKDPHRMLLYLRRHGGVSAAEYARAREWPASRVHRHFHTRSKSSKEHWTDPTTPGFWARWLLWSEPSLARAARRVQEVIGVAVRLST
jgi:hypothetical protein